ncbi:MAG: UvrB/UvrC motif-containing protein [Elusimicrobia bacterium]|nr:UvrB/UvrC motif-containing protein [Elusimicrobiota bacterium]
MLCSRCQRNESEVLLKQIAENYVSQTALCRACAEKALAEQHESVLTGLLADILSTRRPGPRERACPACGLTFARLRDSGRVGCAECYSAFREALDDALRRVHGASKHTGLAPAAETRRQLDDAIAREDFEAAARLRDRLREP